MSVKKPNDSEATASPLTYVLLSIVGLLVALGFTIFYIYEVPKHVDNFNQSRLFYLLLFPWALSSSAFLFGAMKSYARLTFRRLGMFVELGGPVTLFCLVLVGGFKLVPSPPERFDLAVRAKADENALITWGEVTLDLPGLPQAKISAEGEANFKDLSAKYRNQAIKILPKVEGFEEEWLTPVVQDNVLTIQLKKKHSETNQILILKPPPPKDKDVKIRVDGTVIERPTADGLGGYKFSLKDEPGNRALFEVFVDGEQVHHDYHTIGTRIEIDWPHSGQK